MKPGRAARHRPARRRLQQSLPGLRARVLRKPRLHPRRGKLAAGDILFLRGKREGIAAVPAEVHREGAGRFRRQAGRSQRRGESEARRRHRDGDRRLEAAIAAAKEARDTEKRKTLQKELADYEKRMAETIAKETRALLKERFPYPIFLYEAEKVGITATGEQDQNELVPNDNQPPGITKTCLELYQEFRRNPKPFFLTEATE